MSEMTSVSSRGGDVTTVDLSEVVMWDWLEARSALTVTLRGGSSFVTNDDRAPKLRAILESRATPLSKLARAAREDVPSRESLVSEEGAGLVTVSPVENGMLAAAAAAGDAAPRPEVDASPPARVRRER